MSGVLAAGCGLAPGVLPASFPSSSNPTSCSFEIESDSDHIYGDGAGGAITEQWVSPASVAPLYEVRVDVNSGSFTSGTVGSWLSCAVDNTWSKTGAGVVIFDVSFRQANGPTLKTYSGVTMTVS